MIRLAGVQRVPENGDRLAGKRLRPEQPQHLGEVAAEQRADVFEHFLGAGADLHQAEIGVDDVNAERRLIDEVAEGVVRRPQAFLGTGAFEAQVGARGDVLQQLGIAGCQTCGRA